jgi:peptide/nickel transport system permease protein
MRPGEEWLVSEWGLSGLGGSRHLEAGEPIMPKSSTSRTKTEVTPDKVGSVSVADTVTCCEAASVGLAPVAQRRSEARSKWEVRPGLVIAGLIVAILLVAAIAPSWLTSGDPLESSARQAFRAPSYSHLLGTDENGRDVWTRLVYGARPSLILGLAATVIAAGIGAVVGLLAGLSHPLVDNFVMRIADVLMAFPEYLVALVVITYCGHGTLNEIAALAAASVPRFARMIRAQAHVVRRAQYVEAAVALGLRDSTVIIRHVLPNAIRPVLVLATIDIGLKIGVGASLSFLGFGAPPPSPEWGLMLSVGRDFLANAWWLTAVPALAIILTVLSITTVGRELVRRSEGKGL